MGLPVGQGYSRSFPQRQTHLSPTYSHVDILTRNTFFYIFERDERAGGMILILHGVRHRQRSVQIPFFSVPIIYAREPVIRSRVIAPRCFRFLLYLWRPPRSVYRTVGAPVGWEQTPQQKFYVHSFVFYVMGYFFLCNMNRHFFPHNRGMLRRSTCVMIFL